MPLCLYNDLLSQPGRAVRIFMKVNNITYEERMVNIQKGEHKTEQYKKVNPFGKIPMLDEFGFKLTESVAIAKYLFGVHSVSDHWCPADVKKQARVEEYLRWYPDNTRKACIDLFLELALYPKMLGTVPDDAKVKDMRAKVTVMVKQLESYFLQDKRYIAGDEISIADLFGVCELVQLIGCHEQGLYESSPIVNAWVERVKQATSPHFDQSMTVINQLRDDFGKPRK